MMPRWRHTVKKSNGWRTDLMASNSITSQAASMKQPTHSQKQHPAESQSQQASLPAINTNPQYAMRGRNKPTMAHLVRPQGPIRQLLRPTPRSWRSKRTQWHSLTLPTTGERFTSTTSSATYYQQTRRKPDGLHIAPSPSFL